MGSASSVQKSKVQSNNIQAASVQKSKVQSNNIQAASVQKSKVQTPLQHGIKVYRDVNLLVDKTWVDSYTGGGTDAVNLTHKSIEVTDIFVINNKKLLSKYNAEKSNLESKASQDQHGKILPYHRTKDVGYIKTGRIYITGHKLNKDINEVYLFHGTKAANIEGIITDGFSLRKAKPGLYGKGVYLAESSQKADQYADPQANRLTGGLYMIVVKTLLGRVYVHDQTGGIALPCYRKGCFTPGCKKHILCDSIVAGLDKKFKEFINYKAENCLPLYVVQYDRKY